MEELKTKDAAEIYYAAIGKINFYVEGLLPQGLNIISGASKAGKSWLVLWLCLKISAGEAVWEKDTKQCDCLYLCLEDNERRIQNRLHILTENPPENLRFGFLCDKAGEGLKEQLQTHLSRYPKTEVIVIDTLQKVRGKSKNGDTQYASDYEDLSVVKQIADQYNICILVVHHNRKQTDEKDPFNEINGTNGIAGTADSMYVLKKKERFSDEAFLYLTGRDILQCRLTLQFQGNVWHLIDTDATEELKAEKIPPFLFAVRELVQANGAFVGTITELLSAVNERNVPPNKASRFLAKFYPDVLEPSNIAMQSARHARGRVFTLALRVEKAEKQ